MTQDIELAGIHGNALSPIELIGQIQTRLKTLFGQIPSSLPQMHETKVMKKF